MNRMLISAAAVVLLLAVMPAVAAQINIPAGVDLLVTLPGSTVNFSGPFEIPADFFGPGSDPFTGSVAVQGVPIDSDPNCQADPAPAEIIIKRNSPFDLSELPSSQTVEIELVQLSLRSVSPIPVSFNQGARIEEWEFEIVPVLPPPAPPELRVLDLERDQEYGGSFSTTYEYDFIIIMQRLVDPEPLPREYTPPQPDQFGGQGPWGIPALPEAPSFRALVGELNCPPCKADDFYLGYDGVQAQPFWLTGQFFNLYVVIPCTGSVAADEATWGELKKKYGD